MMPLPKVFEFNALGTHWWIEPLGQPITKKHWKLLKKEFNRFESLYSRFRINTEVSKLNKNGFINNPSSELIEMFEFAKNIYDATDGVFNVFVGGILESIGYGHGENSEIDINSIWDSVQISKSKISIPKNAHVDFGGFGKGWLIDNLVEILTKSGLDTFIINGGGDIYVKSNVPIEIMLEDPFDPTKCFGSTKITEGALAASSVKKRAWRMGETDYHHIINPETKNSSEGAFATFVRASDALTADCLATCLIIKPSLKEKLENDFGIKSIVVS